MLYGWNKSKKIHNDRQNSENDSIKAAESSVENRNIEQHKQKGITNAIPNNFNSDGFFIILIVNTELKKEEHITITNNILSYISAKYIVYPPLNIF
jgi:hypothetical protein